MVRWSIQHSGGIVLKVFAFLFSGIPETIYNGHRVRDVETKR